MLELGDGLILIIYFENSSRGRFPRTKIPPSICTEVGVLQVKRTREPENLWLSARTILWQVEQRQLGRAREVTALASASGDVLHF